MKPNLIWSTGLTLASNVIFREFPIKVLMKSQIEQVARRLQNCEFQALVQIIFYIFANKFIILSGLSIRWTEQTSNQLT